MNTKEFIKKFIKDISCKYPSLNIGYNYDDVLDEYDIWHTDQELGLYNKNFEIYAAKKAREYLFKNNIYNFNFGYDHEKYEELKGLSKFQMDFPYDNITYNVNTNKSIVEFKYKWDSNVNIKKSQGNINFKETNSSFVNNYKILSCSRLNTDNTIYQSNKFREAVWWTRLNSRELILMV